ncbi:MAG: hypothetical protein ABIK81_03545 [candidate division WOR-3 bacterium]
MPRGCLFQLLVAGIILFLFIFFYLRYLEPKIKGTVQILKEVEGVSGERKIKRKKKVREIRREEIPKETTGIEEIDQYQKMLQDAQRKLKGLRRAVIRPR